MESQVVEYGDCHCGCGEKTLINSQTDNRRGWIKGEPRKYLTTHHLRVKPTGWKGNIIEHGGYAQVGNAIGGYYPLHRITAERAIGKSLPPSVVVHHFRNELVVCENNVYHLFLHQRQRAYFACGNVSWRKCKFCKEYDAPENLSIGPGGVHHRPCKAEYERNRIRRVA